ncbi:type III secretion protein [Pseudomonas fluorescens]|uniref:type III secretion protein n=1 Tax=unclassified Pseudomonas TaxID=196821 RepID=UPI001023E95D|nr:MULTISPECIES: type III secretion protein [unclassified Pseudomonas]QQU70736.1 type III secretion protein [Pseudomonas fluorescens]RZI28385.1 type III secretion protein [Pseudomonas sp. 770NI]
MLTQVAANFYAGLSVMLGGGRVGGACAKHSHNDSVSRRELSDALKSFKYGHSQPTTNFTINNSVSNANSNANTNAQIGR